MDPRPPSRKRRRSSACETGKGPSEHSIGDSRPRAGDQTGSGTGSLRYRLLACGCNVYGQLGHGRGYAQGSTGLFSTVESPTVVMAAGASLRVLYVGVHTVCVERDGCLYLQGLLPTLAPAAINPERCRRVLPLPLPSSVRARDVAKAFGTQWSFVGLILCDGSICTFSLAGWSLARPSRTVVPGKVADIQINNCGELCILSYDQCHVDDSGGSSDQPKHSTSSVITVYPPLPSITDNLYDSSLQSLSPNLAASASIFRLPVDTSTCASACEYFTSIAATATGFVALTNNGRVHTYGDGRYNSLGRALNATHSAGSANNGAGWGLVAALDGIVIQRIAAARGGHIQLALSADRTAYIWGGDGTENVNTSAHPPTASPTTDSSDEDVCMVDIASPGSGEPVDFSHAAVGEDHVVLVEADDGGVWVSGGSDMAQTGFGQEYRCLPTALVADEETRKQKAQWRRWDPIIEAEECVVQVECGFGCTLVVVGEVTEGYARLVPNI
ncbi:hypothetical protein DRE_03227 [Drechslerella stenobrocha 248]|uniref:Uncharacterized protein n=1 Tax=Drechslerella stenobrocha 248 TaxID=1043628 RepID=W7I593_9PEZI|nr:hypothetical protein DRE_03227 [Drechslerella stenobrocha 248]